MRYTPIISVTNKSTVVPQDEFERAVKAVQHQVSYHFRRYWDGWARLTTQPVEGAWIVDILDDSDEAGALGYHWTPEGNPEASVFAKTDQQYGLSWTVTLSHEVLEMLADPWINLAAQVTDTDFYGYEVGDPVEADADGYTYNGILLSNFVLPAWFIPESEGPKYDYKGLLSRPLQLREGGYVSIFKSGSGWTQFSRKQGQTVQVELEDSPRFRSRGASSRLPNASAS